MHRESPLAMQAVRLADISFGGQRCADILRAVGDVPGAFILVFLSLLWPPTGLTHARVWQVRGVGLFVTHLRPVPRRMFGIAGIEELLGTDAFCENVGDAMARVHFGGGGGGAR
jgi:hypothetical protein